MSARRNNKRNLARMKSSKQQTAKVGKSLPKYNKDTKVVAKKVELPKIKVTVTEAVQKKISYLCSLISEVEWSGILIYKVEGTITDYKNMNCILLDIIPMNKGEKAYTSFNFVEPKRDGSGNDDKFVSYMEKELESGNEEAMEYKMGLIHSHNTMNVFFSSTDDSELMDNAPGHDFYLSFIVNNKNEMTAKVAIYSEYSEEKTVDMTATNENGEKYVYMQDHLKINKSHTAKIDCEIINEFSHKVEDDFFMDCVNDILERAKKKAQTTPYYTPPAHGVPATVPGKGKSVATNIPATTTKVFPKAEGYQGKMFNDDDLFDTPTHPINPVFPSDEDIDYFIKYLFLDGWKTKDLLNLSMAELFNTVTDETILYEEEIEERVENILATYYETYMEVFNNDKSSVLEHSELVVIRLRNLMEETGNKEYVQVALGINGFVNSLKEKVVQ